MALTQICLEVLRYGVYFQLIFESGREERSMHHALRQYFNRGIMLCASSVLELMRFGSLCQYHKEG